MYSINIGYMELVSIKNAGYINLILKFKNNLTFLKKNLTNFELHY